MTTSDGQNPIPAEVQAKLAQVTDQPGVYLMHDGRGRVIYVGKALSLKKRLASYFKPAGPADPKTVALLRHVAALSTIITASEKEALILESNLIKKHRPRYNVVLKDDKRYPSLRLDRRHAYPRLTVVRRVEPDGALYFGPYASAAAVRATLRLINKLFKLRKCRDREFRQRTRPCLHHQMGACYGPCCLPVNPERYAAAVNDVVLFLRGRTPRLIRDIRRRMLAAAAAQDFETAAVLRDRTFALEKTLEKQVAVTTDVVDRDVLAAARSETASLVTLLTVRGGFLLGSRHFDLTPSPLDEVELLAGFIRQYYTGGATIPSEVLVGTLPEDVDLIEAWLTERKGRRVRLHQPLRGEKAKLLQMAVQNAADGLKVLNADTDKRQALMSALARHLRMDRLPRRIECVDISTTGGRQSVGAVVLFSDAVADTSGYRRYIIRSAIDGPDDYAAMAEVLGRRLRPGADAGPMPDLLLVDGGKGQMNVALRILDDLGLSRHFAVAAIAKADKTRGETDDRIFLPGRANPVVFGRDPACRLLLQAVRDEAHRFAITFHRRRRVKAGMASAIDGVAGIGPQRKRRLMAHFETVARMRRATVDQLVAAGLPLKTAMVLHTHLIRRSDGSAGNSR